MPTAIILAAGIGQRMHRDTAKQLILLDGKPLFSYAVQAFLDCPEIARIVLSIRPEDREVISQYINSLFPHASITLVNGGATRQESAFLALESLQHIVSGEEIILIHDAARPFVDDSIIAHNIEMTRQNGNAITAIPVTDTMIQSYNSGRISKYLSREAMWAIQTPQTFLYQDILAAHLTAKKDGKHVASDDSQLLFHQDKALFLVEGTSKNIKITTNDDLALAEGILAYKK